MDLLGGEASCAQRFNLYHREMFQHLFLHALVSFGNVQGDNSNGSYLRRRPGQKRRGLPIRGANRHQITEGDWGVGRVWGFFTQTEPDQLRKGLQHGGSKPFKDQRGND